MKSFYIYLTLSCGTVILAHDIDVQVLNLKNKSSHVTHLNRSLFDSQGHLTAGGIKKFFENAYKARFMPDSFFQDSKNLNVTQFAKTAGGLPIFSISNLGRAKRFAVKEVPKAEAENLRRIYSIERLKSLIYPVAIAQHPELVLPTYMFTYLYDHTEHSVIVMPMSPGTELSELMLNYAQKPSSENLKEINKAFYSIGATLANFQKHLGSLAATLVHGDFHCKNIFLGSELKNPVKQVYWIDAERMTLPRKPQKLFDIIYLLSTLRAVLNQADKATWDKLASKYKERFIKNATQSLISGYISTYSSDQASRKTLYHEIYDKLYEDLNRGANPLGVWQFLEFLSLYKNSIKEALDAVRASL